MTREELAAQLDRAGPELKEFPVAAALAGYFSEELKKGEPPWWRGVSKAWENRAFADWTEAWGLLLTCVHYEALKDADSPLGACFPSCGSEGADPTEALAKFLVSPPKSFFEHLRTGHRRNYVESRAPLWVAPAMLAFQSRDLPFYLVEVNAGAGLNLAADRVAPQKDFDSTLVAARIGLDSRPLAVGNVSHRRWLTASHAPDDLDSIQALDKTIKKVQELCLMDADFLQLVSCAPEAAARLIAKNFPADDSEVGLLVYNMGTTVRMADPDYEAYRSGMADLLEAWGDRGLWVEVEAFRGEPYSTTYQLRLHRLGRGGLESHIMASFDFSAKKIVTNLPSSAAFLFPPVSSQAPK